MKALSLTLLILCFLSVGAQDFNLRPGKTTDKYGLKLKKDFPVISSVITQRPSNLDRKRMGFGTRPDSTLSSRPIHPEKRLNNWYKQPPETNVARIPNALPYLIIPDIAAIPNPLYRSKKAPISSAPLN